MPVDRRSLGRAQQAATAAARVRAASDALVVQEVAAAAASEAVSGDLIETSPQLREKIREIEQRLGDLEPDAS